MAIELTNFVTHTLNGLQYGFILFLIASGLTVILGILDVLNLAHGELFALGAYVAFSVFGYLVGALSDPTGAAELALFVALTLLPLYDRDEVYQLVLTFGLLLVIIDLNKYVWGPTPVGVQSIYSTINRVPAAEFVGLNFPTYKLLIIAVGAAVVVGLFWFFNRTKTGRIIRATAIDREMATAIGASPDRTFTLVFALGAFVGALLVGVLSRWAIWQYPAAELAAPFAIMAVVLLVKPEGLFGTWGETG
ncbi:branched-chain amino acid ABC transporter permease [Halobacteriales archaeon QS_9_68_17]|nr:MAG: branched-chain amino acid ABC transporter permease [Halobacteriales archaeon QS_9_68_17]